MRELVSIKLKKMATFYQCNIMNEFVFIKLKKMYSLVLVIIFICGASIPVADAMIEEMEVTPSNTNGIELGELSFMQLVLFALIFLKLSALYNVGVLPVEIDLGALFTSGNNSTLGGFVSTVNNNAGRGLVDPEAELSTYFLDCPLQFVCDVDAWASRDHDFFAERLIASWFRNPNYTWHHEKAGIFGGRGTCREMYPCPFDVQEVVGIRIPGSQRISSDTNEISVDDSYSFF
ncbi:uncharacterized protein [Palaemon carinicauda]|uniref:uncharacterized protein isoform X1 n=1 Tax=Palaemon carinicauda TaxID=392227 RepID=UPI0035B5C846